MSQQEQMEAAILFRIDRGFYENWSKAFPRHSLENERLRQAQKELPDKARQFADFKLGELARGCVELSGGRVKGLSMGEIIQHAMQGSPQTLKPSQRADVSFFSGGGAQSTSDFPNILANVANKSLRRAYEAAPRTFQPFSREVSAPDFKPINRTQLSDAPTLQPLNEEGEYTRAHLSDSNQSYSLRTFGEIVSITRKAIVNDDLRAFDRVPTALGIGAARLESDTVWAVLTGNQIMGEDGVACFNSAHGNYFTGANSALSLGAVNPPAGITQARMKLRQQVAPNKTPLNLIPRFVMVPTTLETELLQCIYPLNLAASDVTKVVPEWVRSIVPIVEPRLDAVSTTGWYTAADPQQIDTVEYCYLDGENGVFIETKSNWESDGIDVKARLEFAAAIIDYRGLNYSAGA